MNASEEERAGWVEGQRPNRHPVARRLRITGGRVDIKAGHYLAQAKPHAGIRAGQMHEGA